MTPKTILLLARGRDRLETEAANAARLAKAANLLLARGRDRLETVAAQLA